MESKRSIVHTFLIAADLQEYSDQIEKLLEIKEFRKFFKQSDPRSDNKKNHYWYAVLNGLQDNHYLLKEIVSELEIIRHDVEFTLSKLAIEDQEILDFLKRLSSIIYTYKDTSTEHDDVSSFGSFLWKLFSGWSWKTGYAEKDILDGTISNI